MSTRHITRLAIGVALFVVLSLMLQVPIYQNYYISLGYFIMAVYLWSFGAVDGTIVGSVGVVLYCIVTGGMRGMPGWTLGNIVIGINLGLIFKLTHAMWPEKDEKLTKPILTIVNVLGIVLSTLMGILLVKSLTETVLYAQPILVRMATNLPATIADIITLTIAFPVAVYADRILRKHFPNLIETW